MDHKSNFCSFGTFALAAEKIEKPEAKPRFEWLLVGRYIGLLIISFVIELD